MRDAPVFWLHFPIWQLREALEDPRGKDPKPAKECQLWVASEWIIQCAGSIFSEMCSNKDFDESRVQIYQTGPLSDSRPLSVERWEFWKNRFSELITDVDAAVASHISDALRSMDAVGK